jgi:hypothetical protein
MVQRCSTCVKHNRVCKVHVRSGRCNECNRRNQRCDVRVTQSEFQRLVDQREKLRKEISAAKVLQEEALKAQEKALEDLRIARAREERLRQQMDLIDHRASEAISVESRAIDELEEEEQEAEAALLLPDSTLSGLGLQLSPTTWGALDGLDDAYWSSVAFLPVDSGGIPEVGSSS